MMAISRWTHAGPWHGVLTSVTVMLVVTSCEETESTGALTVRDSAGITIVENGRDLDAVEALYTLGAEASLRIGVVAGDDAQEFSFIRAVRQLPSERVVVLDGRTQELRFFGPTNEHLFTRGGAGDGPGELRSARFLGLIGGDSIAIWDLRTHRLTVYSEFGELGRTTSLSGAGDRPARVYALSPGDLLFEERLFTAGPTNAAHWIRRDSILLRFVNPGGQPGDTLAVLPADEALYQQFSTGGALTAIESRTLPFGRSTIVRPVDDQILIAMSDRFELRLFDPSQAVTRIIRVVPSPHPVSEAEWEEYAALQREGAEDAEERRTTEDFLERVKPTHPRPAFGDIQVAADGRLWVSDFRAVPGGERDWWVFEATGELRGKVVLPDSLEVHQVLGDAILGVVRNELDVPFVVKMPLEPARD